jgi:hypothetical protein
MEAPDLTAGGVGGTCACEIREPLCSLGKSESIRTSPPRQPHVKGKQYATDKPRRAAASRDGRTAYGAAAAGDADRRAMAELSDNQRAVLEMLTASRRGYSLSTVISRGFAFEMLQGLVRTGLASTNRDVVGEDGTKVPHLRISEAGRRALAK